MDSDHPGPKHTTRRELRKQFRYFLHEPKRYADRHVPGNKDLRQALETFRNHEWPVYAFGGLPRDLAYYGAYAARPRDLDFVVDGVSTDAILSEFQSYVSHTNQFGGVCLSFGKWDVDIWPLRKTWAFQAHSERWKGNPDASSLPETTFLNVEAVAVKLSTRQGKGRVIHEHNFFSALRKRVLDVNFEPNPNPDYCVLRTLLIAARFRFRLSHRLMKYIVRHVSNFGTDHLVSLQRQNYKEVRRQEEWIRESVSEIRSYLDTACSQPLLISSIKPGNQKDWAENVQLDLFRGTKPSPSGRPENWTY